jgi:hypothetical protein
MQQLLSAANCELFAKYSSGDSTMGIASKRRTTLHISKGCAMRKTAWMIGLASRNDAARTRPVHKHDSRTGRVPVK